MFALQVAVMKGRGGVFTSLLHYARMFDSVGVRSLCLYRGPAAAALREGGVDVVDAPASLTSPLFALTPDLGRLRTEIRARGGGGDPDFAMVHSDLALRNVRRMFPNAVIMTRCHSDKTKRKRDADIVVTLNPEQHERVTRELVGSRARTFMLGHPFVMQPEPQPVAGEGPLRINYVARFVAEKQPDTFLWAAAAMSASPAPKVRMIGDGPELERITEAARAFPALDIEFLGWRANPFEDFTRNDVLVLPSAWEGLPWLLLESQVRCVPTIAADIPGNALALGGGAYGDLFPVGDAAALAARLDAAIVNLDPLRAKAERGRADMQGRFGPRAFWTGLQAAMAEIKQAQAPHA